MGKNKEGLITRLKNDDVKRARFFLTFSTLWALVQCLYNAVVASLIGLVFSWFIGLAIWFAILFITKASLLTAANKMSKGKKHAKFKKIAFVYLIINSIQILAISISPVFASGVFIPKIKQFTIVSLIVNTVNSIIFITSWTPVNKNKFTLDEYSFLKSKQYIGRSEGFFTLLVVVLNILVILNTYGVTNISRQIMSYIYLGIGVGSAIYSLALGIWLKKTNKLDTKK